MCLLEIMCFGVGRTNIYETFYMLSLRHKRSIATPSAWLPKQPAAEPALSERPGRIPFAFKRSSANFGSETPSARHLLSNMNMILSDLRE